MEGIPPRGGGRRQERSDVSTHGRNALAATAAALALLITGCDQTWVDPPKTTSEWESMPREGPGCYPLRTVVLYNLQRTFDPNLAENCRLSSLHLVDLIGGGEPEVREGLVLLRDEPDIPAEIEDELHRILDGWLAIDPALAATD